MMSVLIIKGRETRAFSLSYSLSLSLSPSPCLMQIYSESGHLQTKPLNKSFVCLISSSLRRPNLSHRGWQFVKLNRLLMSTGRCLLGLACLSMQECFCCFLVYLFYFIFFMKEDDGIWGLGTGESRLMDKVV